MIKTARFATLLALAAVSLHAQENYSQWQKFRNVAVNTKSSGANVSVNLTNFPVLLRLDSANANDVFTGALAGGADLRFTNPAGTVRRAHQIESWDATAKTAAIWVLADTVKGNDSLAMFRMYWGKVGAADSSNGTAVFSNGYANVWHLGNADSTAPRPNAIAGGNPAVPTNFPAGYQSRTGVIGKADTLRGGWAGTGPVGSNTANLDRLDLGTNTINYSQGFTFSAWVYQSKAGINVNFYIASANANSADAATTDLIIVGTINSGTNNVNTGVKFRQRNTAGTANVGINNNSGGSANNLGGGLNVWRHVVYTKAAGTGDMAVYLNGTLLSTSPASPVLQAYTTATRTQNWIGPSHPGLLYADSGFAGLVDEARLANVGRNADWTKLEFETQKANANAVRLDTTITQTITPVALTNLRYVPANTATNDTLALSTGTSYNIVPTYTGGPADSIKIIGTATLPAGLTFNMFSGAISGIPTATFTAANRTIRAYGKFGGKDSTERVVSISAVLGPLANLHYSPDTTTYFVGVPVSKTPTSTGRAATKFKASGLPAGLSLDSVSGLLSGTPTTVSAATNYTVTATNTVGPDTATRVLRLTVTTEDYATWTQRDTLWLNTTPGNGAGTTGLVRNFPVLVRLDSSAFTSMYTQSIGRGADLRFLKGATNVRLPHQIESWDSTARKAAVWILVDSVKSNERTQTIRMLWGKAGVPDLSSGPSVFDTANGFVGVWHLSGTGNAADATSNGFTATNTGSPPSVTGLLGPGRSFNGTSQYFIVANNARLNITQNLTISAWVNAVDWEGSRYIVAKATGMNANSQYGLRDNSTGGLILETANTSAGIRMDNPSAGAWHLITGTYGGGFGKIHLDGAVVTSVASAANLTTTTETVGIGRRNTGAGAEHWFSGLMDEVRIQNALRDSNWIKLEYENQKAAQSVVWLSQPPVVGIGGHSAARLEALGFSVKAAAGAGLLFRLQGQTEGRSVLSLVDMWGRTVWSGAFSSGASELAWDGRGSAGNAVSAGVYVARLTVLDKQGKAVKVMDKKVPYTR